MFLSLSLLFPSREEEGKSGEEFFASLFLFLVASSVSACLSLFSLPLQLPVMRLAASLLALALALLAKSVSAGPNAICQWKPACVWWSWWSRNCLAKKRAGNAQSAIDLSLSTSTSTKRKRKNKKKLLPQRPQPRRHHDRADHHGLGRGVLQQVREPGRLQMRGVRDERARECWAFFFFRCCCCCC